MSQSFLTYHLTHSPLESSRTLPLGTAGKRGFAPESQWEKRTVHLEEGSSGGGVQSPGVVPGRSEKTHLA